MENSDAVRTEIGLPRAAATTNRLWLTRVLTHLPWVLMVVIVTSVGLAMLINPGFRAEWNNVWAVLTSGNQQEIRAYIQGYGAWAPVASVMLMTLQVIVAPIPASVVQLSNGVVYGIVWGSLLNLIGQMIGAAAAFFIARSLGFGATQRLAGKIDKDGVIERWLHHWGARALLIIRAIPGMPSDFVSYLAGLTSMPAGRYLTVSLLGYIPQSIAYAWLGEYAMDWFGWIILAGFAISGIIGLVVWQLRKRDQRPARKLSR